MLERTSALPVACRNAAIRAAEIEATAAPVHQKPAPVARRALTAEVIDDFKSRLREIRLRPVPDPSPRQLPN